jgi:hypothetical protein
MLLLHSAIKKYIFLGFCLSGEPQLDRVSGVFGAPSGGESINH